MSRKSPKSPKLGGYRSKFEQAIAWQLKSLGLKFKYEPDVLPYYQPVRNGKCKHCHHTDVVKRREYTPDFRIGLTYLEGKGKFTGEDRSKFIAVKECNPSQDIRFVFMRDNYLRKGSKVKYSEWATKHGYPWCIGPAIPKEWVEEILCEQSRPIVVSTNPTVGVTTPKSSPSSVKQSSTPSTEPSGGHEGKVAAPRKFVSSKPAKKLSSRKVKR